MPSLGELFGKLNIKNRNTINVLFCGGSRVGKTSVMAAMESNMLDRFPAGTISLRLPNSGRLADNRLAKESKFLEDNDQNMTFYADERDTANADKNEYRCQVNLEGRAGLSLNFIDIPGEWFIDPKSESDLMQVMKSAQILVVAVDSPHLMENPEYQAEYGRYHNVFNRAPEVTRFIEKTLQGDNSPRLVLFVPVKCEVYRKGNMKRLLECVHKGYKELIHICEKANCAVACTPCMTMGGLEFLNFVPRREGFDPAGNRNTGELAKDENGRPLQDVMLDENGVAHMTYVSEYIYLLNNNNRRYYAPMDCDQPLDYILLFLFGVGKMRKKHILSGIVNALFDLPDQKILDSCKSVVKPMIKTAPDDGFEIISDPYNMF